MSRQVIGRRDFLVLPLAFLMAPLARAYAATVAHSAPYRVDVRLLYGALAYRIDETLAESIDRAAVRSAARIMGPGGLEIQCTELPGGLRHLRWGARQAFSCLSVSRRRSPAAIS